MVFVYLFFTIFICLNIYARSSCGYDHTARKQGRKHKLEGNVQEPDGSRMPSPAAIRHAPYNFTGCLAHADVTYIKATRQPLRIVGYFEHNDACQASMLKRTPAVPLHPHVYEVAV